MFLALLCLGTQRSFAEPAIDVTSSVDTTQTEDVPREKDTDPPKIVGATGNNTFDWITVTFSEAISSRISDVASNYKVSEDIKVISAELVNPVTVNLATSLMEPETDYTLSVTNITDIAGNEITVPGNKITFPSFVFTTGLAEMQIWTDISGGSVADLTADPRFPDSPDLSENILVLESGDSDRDNFGARITTLVTPTESGSYIFYLAADDSAALYLSTDENPANRVLIAAESTVNQLRAWSSTELRPGCPDACENQSAPIRLLEGNHYFVELLFKGNDETDYAGVAWTKEGEPPLADGSAPITGDQFGLFTDPGLGGSGGGGGGGGDAKISSVSLDEGNILIEWSDGGILEDADDAAGPWNVVPDASSPASIPVAGDKKFYRVR